VRAAAAELDQVDLTSALGIALVLLRAEPESYEPAAVRWLGRLLAENPRRFSLDDASVLAAGLGSLRRPQTAHAGAETLAGILEARGAGRLARPLAAVD
jgi:hypothetical protein